MRNSILLICLLLVFSANSFTAAKAQAVDVNDSLALVDLYNSTNGSHWYNHQGWLTKAPVSKWQGITVTGTRVTEIYLADNLLSGGLPAAIGNLTALTSLDLFRNSLTGSIPAAIGNLTSLVGLDLFSNALSGAIPSSIGNLASINFLYLSNNQFTGSIPASVGKLSRLSNLGLDNNQLSGSIPASLGNLKYLNYLALSFNQLTGGIPASLAGAHLQNVYLNNNQLSGDLAAIAKFKLLNHFDVSYNQLSGTIDSVTGLQYLYYLNLSNNQFSGEIPSAIRNLTSLYYINLSNNRLTKMGNVEFDNKVKKSTIVNVSYNRLTFDGLESLKENFRHPVYSPQALLPVHQNGNLLSVYAGGTLSNNTYHWYRVGTADSTIINGDSTFYPAQSGRYYAHVTNSIATQLTLTTDTINYTATALAQSKIALVNAVHIANTFSVYPNPATNFIHIQTTGTATILLTNSDGKTLLTKTINNNEVMDVGKYANGVYYIKNTTTGEVQKIIVIH